MQLRSAIEAGVIQHRLVVAERVLLQETLIGCIKALIDVLAITNPVAFGRATRIKRQAADLAAAAGAKGFWQLEAAAMLSQIGYISLPSELVEKALLRQALDRRRARARRRRAGRRPEGSSAAYPGSNPSWRFSRSASTPRARRPTD